MTSLRLHLVIAASVSFSVAVVNAANPIEQSTRSGPVTAAVRIEPAGPRIGDPLTLTLRVEATKGVEVLMPEFGDALDHFAIVDFGASEEIGSEGQTILTHRYQLQSSRSGEHVIPPIMVEFVDRRDGAKLAPEPFDAYELLTERLQFEVKSLLPQSATAELNPPLGELPPLHSGRNPRWLWVVALLIVIVVLPFVLRSYLASRRKARQHSAYEIAFARLDRLWDMPRDTPEEVDAFYVELSAIIRRYLEDRFQLRAPERTTEEFLGMVSRSPDLSREHQVLLRDFLRQADLVKFANYLPPGTAMDESVEAARRFLQETRHSAEELTQSRKDAKEKRISGSGTGCGKK